MTAAHSKVGASTCERWWNCPGSVAAVAKLPPQIPSPYAAEGTAAHELAEKCLRENSDAWVFVGQFSKGEIEWTDEMAEAVQVYLDTIRDDMRSYNSNDLVIEQKFHLKEIDESAFGTNDAMLQVFLTKIIIYDFKYGAGVAVDAEDNKQGMYYGLGGLQTGDYENIEIVIVQPRAIHRDGPVRRWQLSKAELESFGNSLKHAIMNTQMVNAPLKCGVWCKKTFCPAMSTCPEVRKEVEQSAMVAFDKPGEIQLPAPESLTPLMLRRLLDSVPLMEAWLKSVWSYAESLANNGQEVLGYKLVRGKEGNRKWAFPVDEKMLRTKFPGFVVLKPPELLSPAQLEKSAGKNHKDEIDALCTRSEGRILLVSEEDPREEVQPNATLVFEQQNQIE